MQFMVRRVASIVGIAVLSACGSGGGGSSLPATPHLDTSHPNTTAARASAPVSATMAVIGSPSNYRFTPYPGRSLISDSYGSMWSISDTSIWRRDDRGSYAESLGAPPNEQPASPLAAGTDGAVYVILNNFATSPILERIGHDGTRSLRPTTVIAATAFIGNADGSLYAVSLNPSDSTYALVRMSTSGAVLSRTTLPIGTIEQGQKYVGDVVWTHAHRSLWMLTGTYGYYNATLYNISLDGTILATVSLAGGGRLAPTSDDGVVVLGRDRGYHIPYASTSVQPVTYPTPPDGQAWTVDSIGLGNDGGVWAIAHAYPTVGVTPPDVFPLWRYDTTTHQIQSYPTPSNINLGQEYNALVAPPPSATTTSPKTLWADIYGYDILRIEYN